MNTGGHWPRGSHRALEGQCLDISAYMSHHTKPYISVIFLKPHLNHPGQHWVRTKKLSNWLLDIGYEIVLVTSHLAAFKARIVTLYSMKDTLCEFEPNRTVRIYPVFIL